jgi:hypothetical protein
MDKTKIKTLEELIKLKNEGHEIIYENELNDGVVRRVEHIEDYYLIVVKLNSKVGMMNLCEFKFYKKPKEIRLDSFYYNKETSNKVA